MQTRLTSGLGLGVIAALFIGVVLLSNVLLSGMRVDLTENQLYTLSDGTRNMLNKLEEPLTLELYFSEKLAQEYPTIRSYGTRVRELLQEFSEHAGSKIRLNIIDPEPFSEDEDRATSYGLTGAPINSVGEKFYFGLVGRNGIGDENIIPFFEQGKENFLEYDISKLVYELANPEKTVIGLISGLPVMGGERDPRNPAVTSDPWVMFQQLGSFFEIKALSPNLKVIPEDVSMLMIVHPNHLDEVAKYAIDQFVLAGGRAAFFVDPNAEREQGDGMTQPVRISNLNQLFNAWGFEVVDNKVLNDRAQAIAVTVQPGQPPVSHLAINALRGDSLSADDIATSQLDTVNIGSSGYLQVLKKADDKATEDKPAADLSSANQSSANQSSANKLAIDFIPLLQSSDDANVVDTARITYLPNPAELLDGFAPSGQRYTVAARISGPANSAFDKAPEGSEVKNPLTTAKDGINIVVVADTDILSDRLWVRKQEFLGQVLATPLASNGDFVVNVLDSLIGSNDLISIRSRGVFARPFDKVLELRRAAEGRFRAKEQELQAELQATERQLAQLQNGKDESQLLSLTTEQQDLLLQFQADQVRVRKELRDVRYQLDKDIDQLGAWLKAINIALIPLLLALFAFFRGAQRKRHA